MNCQHYWKIDSKNKGICKKCGEVKDYQPGLDKLFGICKGYSSRAELRLDLPLCNVGGYAVQGSYRSGVPYRISDYCFTVDNTDTI